MNIGKDNIISQIWGDIITEIGASGLISVDDRPNRTVMWTTRLCKSEFPLEDIALNNQMELRIK